MKTRVMNRAHFLAATSMINGIRNNMRAALRMAWKEEKLNYLTGWEILDPPQIALMKAGC